MAYLFYPSTREAESVYTVSSRPTETAEREHVSKTTTKKWVVKAGEIAQSVKGSQVSMTT